ncbi:hypothetical protein [Myxosarcina sp. GI1(2024)]
MGNDNFGLRVSDGKNFSLLGGNVNISGNIYAFGGRINIGGLTERGKVDIAPNGNLIFPQNIARADMLLTNGTLIDTTNQTGGTVRLSGSRISLRDESNIFSLTLGSQKGGNIILDATELVGIRRKWFSVSCGFIQRQCKQWQGW